MSIRWPLVRTYNSRTPSFTFPFGEGGWNHNYNWILEDSPTSTTSGFQPARFTVDFPDGRVETFRAVTWDRYYRVRPGNDTPAQTTSSGVRERFQPLSYGYCYLILPDGGKIQFYAEQHNLNGQYYYKYTATAIIDPFGSTTTLTWQNLTNGWKRLSTVTDPTAGRYLQFTYTGQNSLDISQVTEFIAGVARRSVNYYYILNWANRPYLDHVIYYNNSNWTARYKYIGGNVQNAVFDLLQTCDDPMYPGPMKRIAYDSAPRNQNELWAVFGQILHEKYWDGVDGHESNGPVISTLSVGTDGVHYGGNYRMETRGDTQTRSFTYTTDGYLTNCTDFMGNSASQGYDGKKYINSVIDGNGHTTNYTCDPITGNVTQVQLPRTPEDTQNQGSQPTVNYTYTNNYYLHTTQGENGQTMTVLRDGNNRVTEVDYPDGGSETFSQYNSFNQAQTHGMVTGGTENFTYDGRGLKQTYRSPDSPSPSPSPSARYQYDNYDRLSDVTDVLGGYVGDSAHTTSYAYNLRGQVTSITSPVFGGSRHTLAANVYNDADGTLQSTTDALGHITSYTYDDYRRLRSVTPPDRVDNTGLHTTSYYYDANGTADDYTLTDSNVRWINLPSGKWIKNVYDYNRRKTSATAGCTSTGCSNSDAISTGYQYDAVGNLLHFTNPRDVDTATLYDERNRPYSVTVGSQAPTTCTYDTLGRRNTVTRPNGQVITNYGFDAMDRVTQQYTTQAPTSNGWTNYSYYPGSGLLHTFQDPQLNGTNDQYTYIYDTMGRKHMVTYPAEPTTGIHRSEGFNYDSSGRLQTYTTRANQTQNQTQTFYYDALNRMTSFIWSDGTPGVTFTYDAASRLIEVDNANATISKAYWNDNSLQSETETATGGVARQMNYTYDADGNRASLGIPGYSFTYDYTNRNQLNHIKQNGTALATYTYDQLGYTGDLTTRALNNGTQTSYTPDPLDRIQQIVHTLNGTTRTINYGYDPASNNRLWAKRVISPASLENNKGEAFSYDLSDQAVAVQVDVLNPDQLQQPLSQSIFYDATGNRNWYAPPGVNKHYDPDGNHPLSKLNQYTGVIINGSPVYNLTYSADANLTHYDRNNSSYNYDAQNRLTIATVNNVTMSFAYDGLNRQVNRWSSSTNITTYNAWDGWNLVQEYHMSGGSAVEDASYLYGVTGLVKNLKANNYYYQDASGSTSHLADSSGHLLEWYQYDLDGTPTCYNPGDTPKNPNPNQSGYGVRHLFTGQQWYSDIGLYDLRNRFYSPDLGRFLQPDPIGFRGDGSNLYRYCHNSPVTWRDPLGLEGGEAEVEPVVVRSTYINWGGIGDPGGMPLGIGFGDPSLTGGNPFNDWGYPALGAGLAGHAFVAYKGNGQQQSSSLSAPPPQNPPTPDVLDPATLETPLVPISQVGAQRSSVPLPTLTNTTYFGGFSLSGIPIVGTMQAGMYINSGRNGFFFSSGNANQKYSIDITGGFVGGYVHGPVGSFRGPFLNSTFGLGPYGASALHNASG